MHTLPFQGSPLRIDLRLTRQFPYSRNFFHRLLENGLITVVGSRRTEFTPKKSYLLQEEDQVTIGTFMRYLDGGILDETPAWEIDIRYEATDYLVIYKPKGVLSHPTSIRNIAVPSVVGGIYHWYKNKPTDLPVGDAPFIRAGLVHRLDRDTDGFMIVAKTETGLAYFKKLFQEKSKAPTKEAKEAVPLKKYYRAVCELTVEGKHFLEEINEHLPAYIEQIVIPKVPYTVPKMGITKIVSFTHLGNNTVSIDLEILTGRTHQIRYHLSEAGLPVVADTLYGATASALEIQLTARKLSFVDNTGKEMVFGE